MTYLKLIIVACLCMTATLFSKTTEKNQTIKVALLLDTSSSMDGLIHQAKAQLWDIINELSYAKYKGNKPRLQIALYEYGNNSLSNTNGYIRRVLRFSNDLDEISKKLFSLTTNGGNEYCGEAIHTAISELEWGKDKHDLKMIFIAGNEPFDQGQKSYKDAISNAQEHDVIVNTIYCGAYQDGINGLWQDGAKRGDGDYMIINHNKKVVHIVTPYDSDILILNKQLNNTYVYYGAHGRSKLKSQSQEDQNAETLDETVSVKRAISKSSRLYNNASWDLIDAEKEKGFRYDQIKNTQLPIEYQNKSETELKEIVAQKRIERQRIKDKIQQLNIKRRAYVAKKQHDKNSKDELNNVMINAIKSQAQRKKYTW